MDSCRSAIFANVYVIVRGRMSHTHARTHRTQVKRNHFTGTCDDYDRKFDSSVVTSYICTFVSWNVGRIITLRRVKACESGQAWDDKINNPRS